MGKSVAKVVGARLGKSLLELGGNNAIIISKNANIGLTIYPDSHHSFDSKSPVIFNSKGYSFKDCLFKLNEEGDVLMNYLSLPMSSPLMQKIGFLFCVKRGVNLGGNTESRKKAFNFAKSFMKNSLN